MQGTKFTTASERVELTFVGRTLELIEKALNRMAKTAIGMLSR